MSGSNQLNEFENFEKYKTKKFATITSDQKISEYDRMNKVTEELHKEVIQRGGHINKSPNAPIIETDEDKISFMDKLYTDDHKIHMEDPIVSEVSDSYRDEIKQSLGHDISDEYWESLKAILSRIPNQDR